MYTYLKVLLLFLYLKFVYTILSPPDLNTNHDIELSTFAYQTYENHCKQCRSTLIIHTEQDITVNAFRRMISSKPNEIALFSVRLNNSTLISYGTYPGGHPDMTIMFLDQTTAIYIEDLIEDLASFPFWYIRSRFLIIITELNDNDQTWLNEMFQSFWLKQVLRLVVCFWYDEQLQVYTYNPFLDNFGYKITNHDELSTIYCSHIKNMYGYPLKSYNLDIIMKGRNKMVTNGNKTSWVGFDSMYMSTICEVLNATLMVHLMSDDVTEEIIQKSDTKSSLSENLERLKLFFNFDVMFNAGNSYSDNILEKVHFYARNDMLILIPSAKQIPRYLYIFLMIRYDVWCATFGSFIGVSLTMLLAQKVSSNKLNISNTLLDNFRLLLTESPPSRKRVHQERFLLMLWVSQSIVFSTLFQSIFMSTLIAPKYYQNIDSLHDLYQSDIKLYSAEFTKFHLSLEVTNETRELLARLEAIPKEQGLYGEDIDWIANCNAESGFIITNIQVSELKLRDKKAAHGAYHIMKESPMPCAYAFFIRKDRLYYPEFHRIMGLIQDAGLNLYWEKYNYNMEIIPINHNETIELPTGIGDNELLNIEHLQSTFMLLIIVQCIALIIFGCEVCIHRVLKRKRNENEIAINFLN